jgi:2,3-bisphosphoglycerate-independent phosphoglycerate mutase
MKYLILVGDGMGDHPLDELGGRTPLEVAETPAIDEICRNGEFFLNHTVPDGFPPGSDVANLSLLGYAPEKYYTGRAPLEAAAMGIRLAEDETAFRCNFVTLGHSEDGHVTMVDFAAGHITSAEGHQLIAALQRHCADHTFRFHPGVSYRNLVVVKGGYPDLTTVPPHDWIEKDVTAHWQRYLADQHWRELLSCAVSTLDAHPVNRRRLDDGKNPANAVWLWGEGKMPTAPTLTDRFGIRGSMISAVDLLKGLGVIAGLSVLDIPGATGYLDTNYEGKADAAIAALAGGEDFVFVHLEAPDEAGHQGSAHAKIQAIEDFDSRIVRPIVRALRDAGTDFRIIVTMDHFTPIALRTHSTDPVPTLLYDSRETGPKSGCRFSERECIEHSRQQGNALAHGDLLVNKLLER